MKQVLFFLTIVVLLPVFISSAQEKTLKLEELAVPNSPAFILLDISPTLIESPETPKEFTLGVLQAFNQDLGFPQNYSLQFTPYWWVKSGNRDVYQFAGYDKTTLKNKPFNGLSFTNFSLAFIHTDAIPDTIDQAQKVFSIGIQSTILKLHLPSHSIRLNDAINEWHKAAQDEIKIIQDQIDMEIDPVKIRELMEILANMQSTVSGKIAQEVNDIITEKPIFSINLAAAYASYGVTNNNWETGRTGVWSTFASFIPIKSDRKSYLDLFVMSRFLADNFSISESGKILKSNSFDLGGKIAIEWERFSVGAELINRFTDDKQSFTRRVGVINYQINNNFFISGTFGKDFGATDNLISLLGINWGFGNEKVNLPGE